MTFEEAVQSFGEEMAAAMLEVERSPEALACNAIARRGAEVGQLAADRRQAILKNGLARKQQLMAHDAAFAASLIAWSAALEAAIAKVEAMPEGDHPESPTSRACVEWARRARLQAASALEAMVRKNGRGVTLE